MPESSDHLAGTDTDPATRSALEAIRREIDALDRELIAAFNRRATLAQKVGEIKRKANASCAPGDAEACARPPAAFYRPEREAMILRAVRAANPGPLPDASVVLLVRELMSACLALEAPMNVAFLGPAGTFTEQAARKHFGHAVTLLPAPNIAAVFTAVEQGEAAFGVVPIENSTEGMVTPTVDRFVQSDLQIAGEVILPIEHALLGHEGTALADIATVHAHPQALAQCREWLVCHLPRTAQQASTSNAQAILDAKAGGADHAAIGPAASGEAMGLVVLARRIQDLASNTTRFLVLGRQSVPPSGDDKTSVMVVTRNRAGALYEALRPFAEAGVSLTRIESRPSRAGLWEYVFFLDLLGHAQDEPVARALEALEDAALLVKRLGSYPRAAT